MPYTVSQLQSLSTSYRAGLVSAEEVVGILRGWTDEWSGEIIVGEGFTIYEWRSYDWRTCSWTEHNPHRYSCETHAVRDGWTRCEQCDEWTHLSHCPDAEYVEGHTFCSSDCRLDYGYRECEYCGEWVHEDDEVWVEDSGTYCSEECANRNGWYRCQRCGDWHNEYDVTTVHTRYSTENWCYNCADDYARYCEECDEYHTHGGYNCDDEWRCENCLGTAQLHRYNYMPTIKFFGDGPLFMGDELETDSGDDRSSYIRALTEIPGFDEHFWMTEDGSLCCGVEITSHPMTLAYRWSLYEQGLYEGIASAARRYGFVSYDSGNCGLHVSVNNSFFGKSKLRQDAGKFNLMRLFQRFENQLTTFSKRTSDRWCHYATSYDYRPKKVKVNVHSSDPFEETFMQKVDRFTSRDRDKYRAVNICHSAHVEIRIFRGTLKWSRYFASLALVEGLAYAAKNHSHEWVESVSWYGLMEEVLDHVSVEGPKQMLAEYLDEIGLR